MSVPAVGGGQVERLGRASAGGCSCRSAGTKQVKTIKHLAGFIGRSAAGVLLASRFGRVLFVGRRYGKPKPADLGANIPCSGVRQAWTARIGSLKEMPLMVQVQGRTIAVASADGVVAVIDATTGGDIWRLSLNEALSAGVGSDGNGQRLSPVAMNWSCWKRDANFGASVCPRRSIRRRW